MRSKNRLVGAYVQMWPRAVFDRIDPSGRRQQALVEGLELFDKASVYAWIAARQKKFRNIAQFYTEG